MDVHRPSGCQREAPPPLPLAHQPDDLLLPLFWLAHHQQGHEVCPRARILILLLTRESESIPGPTRRAASLLERCEGSKSSQSSLQSFRSADSVVQGHLGQAGNCRKAVGEQPWWSYPARVSWMGFDSSIHKKNQRKNTRGRCRAVCLSSILPNASYAAAQSSEGPTCSEDCTVLLRLWCEWQDGCGDAPPPRQFASKGHMT